MVRVLPVPAPARMQTGPDTACAAVRCSSSRPASTASAPDTVCVLPPTCDIPTAPSVMRTAPDPPSLRRQLREASPGMSAFPSWTRSGPGLDPRPPTREDHYDDCRTLYRHHVHHVVVRLLHASEEDDAARGHRFRRGGH